MRVTASVLTLVFLGVPVNGFLSYSVVSRASCLVKASPLEPSLPTARSRGLLLQQGRAVASLGSFTWPPRAGPPLAPKKRPLGMTAKGRRARGRQQCAAAPAARTEETRDTCDVVSKLFPLHVVIAGAGVGGLTLANALIGMPHVKTTVLEKTSKFKRFGGPIQLASNAMQVLKSIDLDMFNQIQSKATFTGNLTNGIKDGIRDEWYAMFDLTGPAANRKMPFTCVVERPDLQEILLNRLPEGTVHNGAGAVSFKINDNDPAVTVYLEDGFSIKADMLIGADGIWSSVRSTMHDNPLRGDNSGATYSGYTVYAGELIYTAPDHGEVGYKVYIGPGQYFVITDIGNRRYQWYAFLARPAGTAITEESIKPSEIIDGCAPGNPAYLRRVFDGWAPDILDIIRSTTNDEIEQRDLYDRPPSIRKPWIKGHVALLGDSIHAMMPNLGQGGCQAIEDAFVVAEELKALETRRAIPGALKRYRDRRLLRSAAVQGLSRFASDIIIRGFDTPAKIVEGRLENFNYAGVMTRLLQPVLPIFFNIQFNFLYSGWRSAKVGAMETLTGLALALVGSFLLLAFGAIAADAGLFVAFGVEASSSLIDSLTGSGFVEAIQGVISNAGGGLF